MKESKVKNKILNVKVLADGLFVDDAQTLESAALLNTETEVTVIYSRNEVEGATRWGIHVEGLLRVNIPSSLTKISAGAFKCDNQVVEVAIRKPVTAIGDFVFDGCTSLASITIPKSVTYIGECAFNDKLQVERRHV